jgi:ABC-2 type transport system permease protein
MLAVIVMMTSAVSYGVALRVRDEGSLSSIMNTLQLPLFLLSGILLPLALAPSWLQAVAAFNPFSWSVKAIRALFLGDVSNDLVWQALLMNGVLAVVAVLWAARAFVRNVR